MQYAAMLLLQQAVLMTAIHARTTCAMAQEAVLTRTKQQARAAAREKHATQEASACLQLKHRA